MTGEILAAPENCYADVKTISTFFSTLSLVSGDLCCHFIYLDALSIPSCLPRNDIQSFCGLSASLAASPRIDSIHKLFFKFRRYILLHSLILSFPILLQYTWALNIDTLYIDHLMRQKNNSHFTTKIHGNGSNYDNYIPVSRILQSADHSPICASTMQHHAPAIWQASPDQRLNLVRFFSICAFHSHCSPSSPWLPARPMPLSTLLSFNVNRGPSSCSPALISSTPLTFSPSGPITLFSVARLSRNTYRCRRTKM